MADHPQRRKKPEYSRLGTVFVISLAMLCLVVVPIKLAVDGSPWAALLVAALVLVLCGSVWLAGSVPIIHRERRNYKVNRPMDVDLVNYDSKRDGVSW